MTTTEDKPEVTDSSTIDRTIKRCKYYGKSIELRKSRKTNKYYPVNADDGTFHNCCCHHDQIDKNKTSLTSNTTDTSNSIQASIDSQILATILRTMERVERKIDEINTTRLKGDVR